MTNAVTQKTGGYTAPEYISMEIFNDSNYLEEKSQEKIYYRQAAEKIVNVKRPLVYDEFRLIRRLLMSQKQLAKLFDINVQTVARYEKNQTKIPLTTDVCLRLLYIESTGNKCSISKMLELLEGTEAPIVREEDMEEEPISTYSEL